MIVVFDHTVDHPSVASRFTIDPPLNGCDLRHAFDSAVGSVCWVEWSTRDSSFTLMHPRAPYAADTKYTFTIDGGFSDLGGITNQLSHKWELSTTPAPRVTNTNPADGATEVAIDQSLTVIFSTFMDETSTAGAVRLTPPIPGGIHVVRNTRDLSRFVVFPKALLQPATGYTLTIGGEATDRNGLRTGITSVIRFRTGGFSSDQHALVLARRPAGGPTAVLLTGTAPAQEGEPAYAITVLQASTCLQAACGEVGLGASVEEYREAALSPDSSRLALVKRTTTSSTSDPELVIVDIATGERRTVALGGVHPSWSPDGQVLCFGDASGRIHLDHLTEQRDLVLPAGAALDAPAVWSPDGTRLALPVRVTGRLPSLELADAALLVRYSVLAGSPPATAPAFSPDGRRLAMRRDGVDAAGADVSGTWVADLASGAAPARLATDLTPVTWTGQGTLLAVSRPQDQAPGLSVVTVASGERQAIAGGPLPSDLATVAGAPGRRQFGYLQAGPDGTVQGWTENVDGSHPTPVTEFVGHSLEAVSISF